MSKSGRYEEEKVVFNKIQRAHYGEQQDGISKV